KPVRLKMAQAPLEVEGTTGWRSENSSRKRARLLDTLDRRRITGDRGSSRGSSLVRVMSLLGQSPRLAPESATSGLPPSNGLRQTGSTEPLCANRFDSRPATSGLARTSDPSLRRTNRRYVLISGGQKLIARSPQGMAA